MNKKEKLLIKKIEKSIDYVAANHDNQLEFKLFNLPSESVRNIINHFASKGYEVRLIKDNFTNVLLLSWD
jgi:hypothetical protein